MVRPYVEKMKQLLNWGKIFLPHSSMRYYPPQFTLRDPIAEGITHAFNQGFEVATIVFNINNLHDIHEQLGPFHYKKFIQCLKVYFKYTVDTHFDKKDIIALHDYYSDGLTLYVRLNNSKDSLSEIDLIMKKISTEVEKNIQIEYPTVPTYFDKGYMFVEKKHYSIQEAIYKAHQQSVAMAEKRVQTEFNEMLVTVSNIVSQRNIKLLAQPIIDVETGEIRAWEMLTRGPKGTPYESPLHLFSVARQTGLLYDLEFIVLEKTLEQIKSTGSYHDFFINFTPLTLGNGRFIRDVKKLLSQYKSIPPSRITIEVTERDSIETMKDFIFNIKVLRTMGFRIAVDDTGAGYASLNTISEIMPDIIKIDRSVIQNIDKNSVKESMLKGLLLVAKETGSLVVAEGIESAEEALVLSRNKVDLAQGYFYARPKVLPNAATS
jgi:EAL domain-containing protein (putative c-di-GMP-specific phosphodiesterase class I)